MVVKNPLMQLFGQSPFKPMQEHVRIAIECANEVPTLFEAVRAGDEGAVELSREKIYTLENKADEIKNELRTHLPKSMFMPVDRRDLLEILSAILIASETNSSAGIILLTSPDLSASSAFMTLPVNTISIAFDLPINLASRCVPPDPGIIPIFISG